MSVIRSSLRRRFWSIGCLSARRLEDAFVQVRDDLPQTLLTEQLDPLAGRVQDRERGLEKVLEAHASGRDAAVFEQAQVLGLLRRERARDEPGAEPLLEFLLTALDTELAQRGANEVDQ